MDCKLLLAETKRLILRSRRKGPEGLRCVAAARSSVGGRASREWPIHVQPGRSRSLGYRNAAGLPALIYRRKRPARRAGLSLMGTQLLSDAGHGLFQAAMNI
jgi:hypothetical protein